MPLTIRTYDHAADFERVGQFLTETWRIAEGHINWMATRWECMHFHRLIRQVRLDSIRIWEDDGEIVAVAHPEHEMGIAYLEVHPDYESLKLEMLEQAELHISIESGSERRLGVFINDSDAELQKMADSRGYARTDVHEPTCSLETSSLPASPKLPRGFQLKSLADDNDLCKLDRCLWRGFNHPGEPSGEWLPARELAQAAPNYKKDLNLVVVAPDGAFVSYCGMWYEPAHRAAVVEPVATDPDYRRMGLGTAVVLEGIRRCSALGATVAYVGSSQPFYVSMGFKQAYNTTLWVREWS